MLLTCENCLLQTQGKGVHMCLNSLADDKLMASVRCLSPDGHLPEIDKYNILKGTALSMRALPAERCGCCHGRCTPGTRLRRPSGSWRGVHTQTSESLSLAWRMIMHYHTKMVTSCRECMPFLECRSHVCHCGDMKQHCGL